MTGRLRHKKGYVDSPWGQIHFRSYGAGETLVLLHQSPLTGAMFDAGLPALAARGVRTFALDTPGYGMSDPPPAPAPISELADALAAAIEQCVDGPVSLLGHHTGAALAASIAARRGDLVSRIVLNGVPFLTDAEREHFRAFKFGPLKVAADGSHLVNTWKQRLSASPGWSNLEAMHRHVAEMLMVSDIYWYAFEAALGHDMEPDLKAISCPGLILSNTGDDIHEASLRARQLRPDLAYAALEGGTHDIVDEQPEAWAKIVADFLGR